MSFKNQVFSIKSQRAFELTAINVFHHQVSYNSVYRAYIKLLGEKRDQIKKIKNIPFLPISFFKTHSLNCTLGKLDAVFTSSGTTGKPSCHHVADLKVYKESFRRGFEYFYGSPRDYHILALLPSYSERKGSSLIYMVEDLIRESRSKASGFFLYDYEKLSDILQDPTLNQRKILLLGVSFALLDFSNYYPINLSKNILVMETGGMKGRYKELPREELHERLKKAFSLTHIHSEYGMTELLSQAYSKGEGIFNAPAWMQVLIRDPQDPFNYLPNGKTGGINIIDLANYHSCAFIATDDLGTCVDDHTFKVLGRLEGSELRGCNLLVS